MIWYMDTSAALKFLLNEPELPALQAAILKQKPTLTSILLLETEMRRAVKRHENLTQDLVSDFLHDVRLLEMPRELYRKAGIIDGANLRSLDALHLAGASMSGADCLVTYDSRLADAGRELGLDVLTP